MTTVQTQREAVTELLIDLRGYYSRALAGPRRTDWELQRRLDLLNEVLLGYGEVPSEGDPA